MRLATCVCVRLATCVCVRLATCVCVPNYVFNCMHISSLTPRFAVPFAIIPVCVCAHVVTKSSREPCLKRLNGALLLLILLDLIHGMYVCVYIFACVYCDSPSCALRLEPLKGILSLCVCSLICKACTLPDRFRCVVPVLRPRKLSGVDGHVGLCLCVICMHAYVYVYGRE
jgi:hypothetical protein